MGTGKHVSNYSLETGLRLVLFSFFLFVFSRFLLIFFPHLSLLFTFLSLFLYVCLSFVLSSLLTYTYLLSSRTLFTFLPKLLCFFLFFFLFSLFLSLLFCSLAHTRCTQKYIFSLSSFKYFPK